MSIRARSVPTLAGRVLFLGSPVSSVRAGLNVVVAGGPVAAPMLKGTVSYLAIDKKCGRMSEADGAAL